MALESIRQQLRQKEADIARLRGQRDVLKEENEMRKAQQAVSNQSMKDVDEFARLQEVRWKPFSISHALLILGFARKGTHKGLGRRSEAATCSACSSGRRKGLPRFPATARRHRLGLCQIAGTTASVGRCAFPGAENAC